MNKIAMFSLMKQSQRVLTATIRRSILQHPVVGLRNRWMETSRRWHGNKPASEDAAKVNVVFIDPEGNETPVEAREGQHVLEVAHKNNIELEGACEASLACSTCHVILEEEVYEKLDEPVEEEEDMLDLAWGLTDTSRLGCQVILRKDLDGMRIQLPAASRNFYVDGHKPAPH